MLEDGATPTVCGLAKDDGSGGQGIFKFDSRPFQNLDDSVNGGDPRRLSAVAQQDTPRQAVIDEFNGELLEETAPASRACSVNWGNRWFRGRHCQT